MRTGARQLRTALAALVLTGSGTPQEPGKVQLPAAPRFHAWIAQLQQGVADGFAALRGDLKSGSSWPTLGYPAWAVRFPADIPHVDAWDDANAVVGFADETHLETVLVHANGAADRHEIERAYDSLATELEKARGSWVKRTQTSSDARHLRRVVYAPADSKRTSPELSLTLFQVPDHLYVRLIITSPVVVPHFAGDPRTRSMSDPNEREQLGWGWNTVLDWRPSGNAAWLAWDRRELRGLLTGEQRALRINGEAIDEAALRNGIVLRAAMTGSLAIEVVSATSKSSSVRRFAVRLAVAPTDGECKEGHGRALLPSLGDARYEGGFRDGLPDGPGRLHVGEGVLVIGTFVRGWPEGPAIRIDTKATRAEHGAITKLEFAGAPVASWRGNGRGEAWRTLDGYEHGPIVLARATATRPSDGVPTEADIPGLGRYVGTFTGGAAHGEGLLITAAGDTKRVVCTRGIPRVVRTLVAASTERADYLRWYGHELLPIGDCLRGDARNGTALILLGREESAQSMITGTAVLYEGGFRDERPHGQGKMTTPTAIYEGPFVEGRRHGRFRWLSRGGVDGLSTAEMEFANGEYQRTLPQPSRVPTPQPEPPRQPRPYIHTCWGCRGLGVYFDTLTAANGFATVTRLGSAGRPYVVRQWLLAPGEDVVIGSIPKNIETPCSVCNGTGTVVEKQ